MLKTILSKKAAGVAVALSSLAVAPFAGAQLSLQYETGPKLGQSYSGTFFVKLNLFDMGTLYPTAPVGTATGYGAGGSAGSADEGASALNDIQLAGPTGGMNGEDTWGIARVTEITDADGFTVWSEVGKMEQLTLMFYGLEDFYISQQSATQQEINGRNLNVDWYWQDKTAPGFTEYNPSLGSGGRTGYDSYNTITDGTKILTTRSTAGFIHEDGEGGGTAAEFQSLFNGTASGGVGQTYLSVTGGTMADSFDTNLFNSAFLDGVTADMFASFTVRPNVGPTTGDWLLRGFDPIEGQFAPIPEPSTYGLIGAGVLLGAVALRRRFQKKA